MSEPEHLPEHAPQPDKKAEIEAVFNHPLFQTAVLVEIERLSLVMEIAHDENSHFRFMVSDTIRLFLEELASGSKTIDDVIRNYQGISLASNRDEIDRCQQYHKGFMNIKPRGLLWFLDEHPDLNVGLESASAVEKQKKYKICAFSRLTSWDQRRAQSLGLVNDLDLTVLEHRTIKGIII